MFQGMIPHKYAPRGVQTQSQSKWVRAGPSPRKLPGGVRQVSSGVQASPNGVQAGPSRVQAGSQRGPSGVPARSEKGRHRVGEGSLSRVRRVPAVGPSGIVAGSSGARVGPVGLSRVQAGSKQGPSKRVHTGSKRGPSGV